MSDGDTSPSGGAAEPGSGPLIPKDAFVGLDRHIHLAAGGETPTLKSHVAAVERPRGDQGHIGINGDKLLLVDHDGLYHMGSGSRIHYRGRFVMIDDVTVFTGSPLLPAFSRAWIEQHLRPLVANGVRVDRTILFVKLLQARHPLALGAVAIAATSAAAVALLSLQGIF